MTVIRRMAPIHVVVHYPKSKEGQEDLAKRVADAHAASVIQRIKGLNCHASQKTDLLDAVIDTVIKRSREQGR